MSDTSHIVQVIGGKGRLSREELYPKPTRLPRKGTAKRVAIVIVCLSAICGVYVLLRGHWRNAQGPFVDMQGITTPSITHHGSEASASKMLDGSGGEGTHGVGVGEETRGTQNDVEGLGDGDGRTEEELTAAQPKATNEEPGRELDLESTERLTQQLIQQQAKILQLLTDKLRKEQQHHKDDQEEQAQTNTTKTQHQEQHHLSQHEPTGQSAEHPQNKSKLTEQSKELQQSWPEATNQLNEQHQPSQQESNNQSKVAQEKPEPAHQQHQTESTEAPQQPERPVQTKHPEVPPPLPPSSLPNQPVRPKQPELPPHLPPSSLPKQPVRPKQPEVPPHLPQPHPLPKMLPPVRQHVAKPFNDHLAQPIPSHDEVDKTSATHRHPVQHRRPMHETGLAKLPYFHPGMGEVEKAEILKQAMFQRNLVAENRRKAQEWLRKIRAHRTS